MADREITYGEKAVGITFNPSGNEIVQGIKVQYAKIIDDLHTLRTASQDGEQARLFSVAITEAQTSQMWAVKAATWRLN